MVSIRLAAAALFALAVSFCSPAAAQSGCNGQVAPGYACGNGTGSLKSIGTYALSSILDQAIGLTPGFIAVRGASSWQGTTALPNGTTATTQSGADSSTKVATTAFVQTAVVSGSLVVGTSAVTGATTPGYFLYNNGGFLGNAQPTGTLGNVVLSVSPSISGLTVTGSFTATGLVTNADLVNSTISGVSLGGTLASLTFGTHLAAGGSSYNGSAVVTITSDATSANTISTIVARDASGNFSAGTITASLTGGASLDLPLTGGTMSGSIAMGGSSVTGAGTVSATTLTGTLSTAAQTNITSVGTLTGGKINTGFVIGGVTMTLGSDATGDVYYRSAGGVLTRLALGSTNTVLTVSGGLPSWQPASVTSIQQGVTTVTSAAASNEVLTTGTVSAGTGTLTNVAVANGLDISGGNLELTAARRTLPSIQAFTSSSGTYTTPANVLWIEIWVQGPGGGGGGSGTTTSAGAGGNGSAGGTCWATSGSACSSPLFSAGAGSGGGAGNGAAGGAGGSASGCNTNVVGGEGSPPSGTSAIISAGGTGAGSGFYGGAGSGGIPGGGGGIAGLANTGGGGGGSGGASTVFSGAGGGAGASCYKLIQSPAGTYTYTVGTGGTGGAAGTSGTIGGVGGSGYIEVHEHYGTWLLKRDLDPVANDNTPVGLNMAA